jgi:ABC-type glucose/galactose transport system permease subunit
MRVLATICAVLLIAYGIDDAYFHSRYATAVAGMVAQIKHHMLGR